MHPTVSLDPAAIEHALQSLPHWQVKNNALERVYQGASYLDALDKLNRVAQLSEAADHHPDLLLCWKTLTIRYWTHTAKGITHLDVELARQVEPLLSP
jgi:4a-hydroxytetrahydrobiopterin dehydratase